MAIFQSTSQDRWLNYINDENTKHSYLGDFNNELERIFEEKITLSREKEDSIVESDQKLMEINAAIGAKNTPELKRKVGEDVSLADYQSYVKRMDKEIKKYKDDKNFLQAFLLNLEKNIALGRGNIKTARVDFSSGGKSPAIKVVRRYLEGMGLLLEGEEKDIENLKIGFSDSNLKDFISGMGEKGKLAEAKLGFLLAHAKKFLIKNKGKDVSETNVAYQLIQGSGLAFEVFAAASLEKHFEQLGGYIELAGEAKVKEDLVIKKGSQDAVGVSIKQITKKRAKERGTEISLHSGQISMASIIDYFFKGAAFYLSLTKMMIGYNAYVEARERNNRFLSFRNSDLREQIDKMFFLIRNILVAITIGDVDIAGLTTMEGEVDNAFLLLGDSLVRKSEILKSISTSGDYKAYMSFSRQPAEDFISNPQSPNYKKYIAFSGTAEIHKSRLNLAESRGYVVNWEGVTQKVLSRMFFSNIRLAYGGK